MYLRRLEVSAKDRSQWRVFIMVVWGGALRYFSLDDRNLQSMTQIKVNSFEATNPTAHGQAGLWEGTTLQICINYHNSCYWVAYWH